MRHDVPQPLVRRMVYQTVGLWDQLWQRQPLVTIYTYHSISKATWEHSVAPDTFAQHLKLISNQAQPTTLARIHAYLQGKHSFTKPVFAITFDDGYADILSAVPILKQFGITPAFFVLAKPTQASRGQLRTQRQLLSVPQIKALITQGWEIGCHGATHRLLTKLDAQTQFSEVVTARKKLEKVLGQPVRYFAYPCGQYSYSAQELAKQAGYDLALTMDDGAIHPHTNPFALPRVGVNRTHSLTEIKHLNRPSVACVRSYLKQWI